MVLASRAGMDAPSLLFGFGQAARATRSIMGEFGRVKAGGHRVRRRDSAVSSEPLGETGEELQRHRRAGVHGCCFWAVAG